MAKSLEHVVPDQVLEKLDSLLAQGIGLRRGSDVGSELKLLRATLSTIQDLVLVAEGQSTQQTEGSGLEDITQAVASVPSLLDGLQLEVSRRKAAQRTRLGSIKREVHNLFSPSNSLVSTISQIEKVRKRLKKIVDEHGGPTLRYIYVKPETREMTQSSVGAPDIIGRDQDKKNIIQLLMHSGDGENVSVLPIVGLGGIGKTTLARMVYDDEDIATHFQKRIWVYVSDSFSITKIIKEMIYSATGEKCGNLSLDQLQTRLRCILDGKRFLLILDDVWNRDREKWLKLRALLMGGGHGSKIVVTTRKIGVGPIMGTIQTYVLSPLPPEESWSLFLKHPCIERLEGQSSNLKEFGHQIVDKCGGIPLQVRMLGNVMYSAKEKEDWSSVRDNGIWSSEHLPVLKLSYESLPSHLKLCFAFCSIFPKNSEIRSNDLAQLWIIHDLIKPKSNQNDKELEDIGNEYIKELSDRSFFQDVEEKEHGACFSFRMHDLVHDLAVSLAQQENVILTFGAQNISRKIRRLSFSDEDWSGHEQEVLNFLGKLNDVQTILFPVDGVGLNRESIANICIERFKSMRVLDLSDSRFMALPESITSLKSLRLLSLKRNDRILKLPDSISRLKNLQALMLGGCSELANLPKDLELMINLRHLEITTKEEALPALNSFKSLRYLGVVGCVNLKYLFGERESFTALRTLFIQRCPRLVSLPCSIRHLSTLKILRIDDCQTLDLLDGDDDNVPGLNSLRLLMIVKLPRLETLPKWILQAAASASNTLQRIVIEACPNFRGLPQEVLQNFDSFKKFKMVDCPESSACGPDAYVDDSKMKSATDA
ncbi:hypothetical protein PVL29_003312 [Vitis rotundifolia]|uniref:Uncharacterized protein n=1 Tax=Vitis rotundifolia TaxID=103349 RepID=A0AA39E3E9_VITRO|nr:hypothetical protein PVL29_003312 [Vitis rotundifolia]